MFVVFDEHVEGIRRGKGLTRHAGEEFLRHTSAINSRLNSIKLVDKCNLNRLLEAVFEVVKLLVRVFEFVSSANFGVMSFNGISGCRTMHDGHAPRIRINEAL